MSPARRARDANGALTAPRALAQIVDPNLVPALRPIDAALNINGTAPPPPPSTATNPASTPASHSPISHVVASAQALAV